MKTCSNCVYWRKEEPLLKDIPELAEQQTRCGVVWPPQYTPASEPACLDFAVSDPLVEAMIRV